VSIHYNKQSQFELFPDAPKALVDTKKAGFFGTTLTVSLDNLVVLGIVLMMSMVVAFSLGVERGKFLAKFRERKYPVQTLAGMANDAASVSARAAAPVAAVKTAAPAGARRVVIQKPNGERRVVILQPVPAAPAQPALNSRNVSPLNTAPAGRPVIVPQPVLVPGPVGKNMPVKQSPPAAVRASIANPVPPAVSNIVQQTFSSSVAVRKGSLPQGDPAAEGVNTAAEKKVDKAYTVQVASYANVREAQRQAGVFRSQGIEALVLPKGKYVIVCVGRFSARQEAEAASVNLRKRFKDCLIRSL